MSDSKGLKKYQSFDHPLSQKNDDQNFNFSARHSSFLDSDKKRGGLNGGQKLSCQCSSSEKSMQPKLENGLT
jgi:hypothetical protein